MLDTINQFFGFTKSDYKELVNKGGLMNDVDYLVQRLHSLQSATVNPFMDASNSSTALKMISEINKLRQSSET